VRRIAWTGLRGPTHNLIGIDSYLTPTPTRAVLTQRGNADLQESVTPPGHLQPTNGQRLGNLLIGLSLRCQQDDPRSAREANARRI